MKRCRTKDGREREREREMGEKGRKGGREDGQGEGGGYSTRGKRQTVNIHKVSEGQRLSVCGRRERV